MRQGLHDYRTYAAIAEAMRWQPIETAPKDGTSMLLCRWDDNEQDVLPIVSGFWSRLSEVWFAEMVGRNVTPTHWMPLPPPPEDMTENHK